MQRNLELAQFTPLLGHLDPFTRVMVIYCIVIVIMISHFFARLRVVLHDITYAALGLSAILEQARRDSGMTGSTILGTSASTLLHDASSTYDLLTGPMVV